MGKGRWAKGDGQWAMGDGQWVMASGMVIGTLANSQATRYPPAIGQEMSRWLSLAYVDQQSRIVIG
jgi:hypothetical protein